MIARGDRIYVHSFRDPDDGSPRYWRDLGALDSYFNCNLDLVAPCPQIDLCDPRWPIRTHIGSHPPACIIDSTVDTHVMGAAAQSLISQGCVISGGRVERSVLSPGVKVRTGALVSECVLTEGVDIGRGAAIRKTIVCPGVRIPDGVRVGYDRDADRRRFTVTRQGVAVVPEEYVW